MQRSKCGCCQYNSVYWCCNLNCISSHVSWNILLLICFQPFKIVKTTLGFQALQKGKKRKERQQAELSSPLNKQSCTCTMEIQMKGWRRKLGMGFLSTLWKSLGRTSYKEGNLTCQTSSLTKNIYRLILTCDNLIMVTLWVEFCLPLRKYVQAPTCYFRMERI